MKENLKITNESGRENKYVEQLVHEILTGWAQVPSNAAVKDWDLTRIPLDVDGEEFIVRMWNIHEGETTITIRWTLFRIDGDHGDPVQNGETVIKINE